MASSSRDLEKGRGYGEPPHHPHLSLPHDLARRVKQFLRPDGRRIHVAQSPEAETKLRHHLSISQPDENFDVYIHGSPEHVDAIRELHAQREQQREDLRRRHTDVFDEFEHVKAELDALSAELHIITEHAVSLDANFSKFGYSAHLRTKDVDSSASSLRPDHPFNHSHHDWEAERKQGEVLRFWKRPVVRQYFHKGLLWRASGAEEVGSFELFFDLLYVGIIGIIGDAASEHPTGDALLKFAIIFLVAWKIWSDLSLVVSWFESDDIFQRICVIFVIVCLFGYTTNIAHAFDTTYISLIAFYLAQRLFTATYFVFVVWLVPLINGTLVAHIILIVISSALWIGSIHVELPQRYGIICVVLCLDTFGHIPIAWMMRVGQRGGSGIRKWFARFFEFYPAINIEHKTERTNAFVTLVFGYSVLATLYQSRSAFGINAFFGKAILGLIQAFVFNWIYFDIDNFNIHVHAIRRHFASSLVWTSAHVPFIMGYVLAAATMSRLVLAHDCPNTNLEDLGEAFALRSEAELSDGLRWFYCVGLGIALLCMGFISLSHVHKKIPYQRVSKRLRVIFRAAVAIVMVCLPLAKSLTSLTLMVVTTCLVVLVLAVDIYGISCVGDRFFAAFWAEPQTDCSYSAECRIRRKEVRDKIKRGEKLTVEDLVREDTNQQQGGAELLGS